MSEVLRSSFPFEFNDRGTWRPAYCLRSKDSNNGTFAFYNEEDGTWHDADASRGTDDGEFRVNPDA